jgi:carboxyl-terminal processing protease
VTTRALPALLVAITTSVALRADQDWRGPALASFDVAWQTISDTYYDPSFGGLDWGAVGSELRPRVEAADSPEAARRVIRAMLARLGQSHFALLAGGVIGDVLPGPARAPIDVRVVASEVIVTRVTALSADERAAVRPGQTLRSIDGRPIGSLAGSAEDPQPDSRARDLDLWRHVFRRLHGAAGSTVELGLGEVGGRERVAHLTRVVDASETVTLGNLPPLHVAFDAREERTPGMKRVGVITFSVWLGTLDARIEAAVDRFRRSDGMVIDLRGNPGGLAGMISGVAGHFVDAPLVLGTMQTRQARLEFKANPRLATADGRRVAPFAGPLAILVDELTASASECFAGALQSLGRARVFGRQTMGQALPAVTRPLPNGDVLMYAIGDFVTPTGRRLEGAGVVPDETTPLLVEALARGRDQALEAALRWIDRRGSSIARNP